MIFIELNEFNPKLLKQAALKLDLKNISRLLEWSHSTTFTNDKYERHGLDPWIQWVSIHTGEPSESHKVRHLGDVPDLSHKQIWEVLSEKNITSGVWGAMNASKASSNNTLYFLPDPWTTSENAFPEELGNFLDLPRYYAQNYGDLSFGRILLGLIKFLAFCLRPKVIFNLLPLLPRLIKLVCKHGLPNYLLFAIFDLVNVKIFKIYYEKFRPDFNIIFLNSIAHLQHHKWTDDTELSSEMRVVFPILDSVLGEIFRLSPESKFICANAFRQVHCFQDGEFLYRPKNPHLMLKNFGLTIDRVEQAMTNDGNIFFLNESYMLEGIKILSDAKINGIPIFQVEYNHKSNKLFYQFTLSEKLSSEAIIKLKDRQLKFGDYFEQITQRSGKHIPDGDIFYRGLSFPAKIANHDIFQVLLNESLNQLR